MKITVNQQPFTTIRGKTILDVLKENNIAVPHECDGKCTCGTCLVEVIRGANALSPVKDAERFHLIAHGEGTTKRLACQAVIQGEVEVRVA